MATELLDWLLRSTFASSLAIVLVLALREPWRHAFGLRSRPLLWLLVPVAIIAVALPAPQAASLPGAVGALATLSPITVTADSSGADSMQAPWLSLWLAGVLLMAARMWRQQRGFRRALGRLQPGPHGSWLAEHSNLGPALVGWPRPRIVLPADFAERYPPDQQRLVLAHERCHLARGDLHACLLASVLRCLFWFNPLLAPATRALRLDLELACDASTLARFPDSRRSYADAMLNTQLADPGLPVGCHWQSSHPLKTRIAMMKSNDSGTRRLLGATIAGCLALATGVTAWASQGAAPTEPVVSAAAEDTTYRALKPPKYPQAALDAKTSGNVVLRVLVGTDGKPKQVEVERSTPAGVFDSASIEAVSDWSFNPAIRGGQPVEGWVLVPIEFSLTEDDAGDTPPPAGALDEIWIRGSAG